MSGQPCYWAQPPYFLYYVLCEPSYLNVMTPWQYETKINWHLYQYVFDTDLYKIGGYMQVHVQYD